VIVWLLVLAITLLTIDITGHRDDGRYTDTHQSTVAKKADRLPVIPALGTKPHGKPNHPIAQFATCSAKLQRGIVLWSCPGAYPQ
jgi:hypothetical protein